MPLNISEQGVTWWMWHFRDIGLVVGLAHCTHLRGRDSKISALTQNDSSHSQKLVFKRITRWGYSKGNQKFSCRVLYFKCCYCYFKSRIGEREQRLLPISNSSVLWPIQVLVLLAWGPHLWWCLLGSLELIRAYSHSLLMSMYIFLFTCM